MTYKAVDVLSFAGGFALGMVQAGFDLIGKRELPNGFGVANCEANRHLLGYQWNAQAGSAKSWEVASGAQVVFGNPPCSGFSVMSAKDFRGANSPINQHMWDFVRYAAKVRPEIVVFESVQPTYRREDGRILMRQLRDELERCTNERYELWHILHNVYSIGGPAQRRRYFWLASRIPFGVEHPKLQYLPVLNDVIGDLEPLARTWHAQPYRSPMTAYAKQFRSVTEAVDGMMTIPNNPLMQRMQDLMDTVSWNPGECIAQVARRCYKQYGQLPKSFAQMEAKIIANDFNMGFTTPTRWDGNKHARVVTGAGLSCIVHPRLNRRLTHREVARILGFPDDWRILPLRNVHGLALTWGKGITVHAGKWIGSWIKRALDGNPGTLVGDSVGSREKIINNTNIWKTVRL